MKTFTHTGVSTNAAGCKVRFANDPMRHKYLALTGHTDIDMIQLPHPMTKEEAIQYLFSIEFDNGNPRVRAALFQAASRRKMNILCPFEVEQQTASNQEEQELEAV